MTKADHDRVIEAMSRAMSSSAAHSSFWSIEDHAIMARSALQAIRAAGFAVVPRNAPDEPSPRLSAHAAYAAYSWPAVIASEIKPAK